jgi:DNA-binding transcriptional LysR family regulator
MELKHLSLFCLIKENQSISKAARMASLSQPTVSQHLMALERELGVALFDRSGRKMLPTHAGEIFYEYAKRILNLTEEALLALDEHLVLVRGDLWLAGSTIPGQYILPGIVGVFHDRYPEVKPHVLIGDSAWVIDRVCAHEVELGFVGARLERPGLSFYPFAKDELILVAPPDHALSRKRTISVNDVLSLPLLSRERGSGTRTMWESLLKQAGVPLRGLNIVAEMGSTEAVIRAVKAGLGVGIVSLRAAEEDLKHGTTVRINLDGPRLERTFYMVHYQVRALSPAARSFEAFVREAFVAHAVP